MANFDNFKEKAIEAVGTFADASAELCRAASEKTKLLAKIAKLNAEIAHEKGNVRRLYTEIGSIYYKKHKSDPEEDLAQDCAEVSAAIGRIVAKKKEIVALKTASDVVDAEVESAENASEEQRDDASADPPEEEKE